MHYFRSDQTTNPGRLILALYAALLLHGGLFAFLYNSRETMNYNPVFCNVAAPPQGMSVSLVESDNKTEADKKSESRGGEQDAKQDKNKGKNKGAKGFAEKAGVDEKEWGDLLEQLEDTSDLREKYPRVFEEMLPNNQVKDSYVKRNRHYEDIIVKDVFPTLETIDKDFKDIIEQAPKDLKKYNKRNQIIEDYRKWEDGELPENVNRVQVIKEGEKEKKALNFPSEKRQQYFDNTLTESKEDQLFSFIKNYMDFDPDKGDLPIATRELYYENLQRIAYMFSRDPSYFTLDYYEENLNKEDFLKNALYLISKHYGTKTASELLFTVENIYEIQQRAWRLYFNFKAQYPNIEERKKKHLRIETLRRVNEKYKPLLKNKDIKTYHDILKKYYTKRLQIVDFSLSQTPDSYRVNDIKFDKGRILWEYGNEINDPAIISQAIRTWSSIPVYSTGDFLNKKTHEKIKSHLRGMQNPESAEYIRSRSLIHNALRERLNDILKQKRDREEKLLWK